MFLFILFCVSEISVFSLHANVLSITSCSHLTGSSKSGSDTISLLNTSLVAKLEVTFPSSDASAPFLCLAPAAPSTLYRPDISVIDKLIRSLL